MAGSKKSGKQLKQVTFNLTEKIIDGEPKEGAGQRSGFWERASATIWGRDQDPIVSLRHAKRRVLVLAYLHTSWSLPFDAVFRSSLVSPHGFVVDFIYLIDIALEVWFWMGQSGARQEYFRRKGIFDIKLGSCLALEALMLAPYYAAYCVLSATGSASTWSGAPALLFASRIFQVNRVRLLKAFFREMEVSVDIDVRKTALVKYVAMILGAAHWLGCIWWFLASLNNNDDSTWVFHYCDSFLSPSDAAQAQGVTAYIAEHGVIEAYGFGSLSDRYLLAVYWGFQSLTNLGYSDLIPDNAVEMIFAWFLCVFQVSFYAYILGTLFSFVVRKDDNAESYRKSIAALESYSRNRNLPKKIHDSLIRYFDFQLSKSDNDDNNAQVVNSLPNALLAKVADFKYSSIVLKAACFTTIPSDFLTSVLERLRSRFLMPNERLFDQGDMSRELCFVEKGTLLVYADNDEKNFIREVNNETNETPMVGEYSFFLTVAQPEMVKAMSNGDVTLLVLSKEDYLSCLENYPESQSIISSRLLAELGLNSKGDEITSAGSQEGDSQQRRKKEKKNAANDNNITDDFTKHLQQILKSRSAEALYEMIVAASEGDGRHVKDLLLQGLDINTCDFDKRTTLHLAAAQGNSKVVQLLLKEGADVHAVDRYGNNPLHEAVTNNHVGVADMLGRAGAELNYANPADYMTAAAGLGDLDKLQTLIAHGIDVNAADKDGRSSLHLVSSEGNLNVVEFLLAHEADPNSKDRWGHTPLDGAVEKGHDLVAAALFARGGTMNMKTAKSLLMKSARTGDLGTLKLLTENGIDVDVKDYDLCCALHVAAMADQPVAVDFLLSNKATVNLLSRWTTTPLDEAIKSQSVLSAKLLMACGGQTFCEHTEQNLSLVRDSDLTLSSLRKMISDEVNLQSLRRREMHKLKQMHIKLLDDVEEGNKVIELQVSNQNAIITKMANSRLAMDFPVFKESDLEYENLYIGLPSFEVDDKHILRVIDSVMDSTADDDDRQNASGSGHDKFEEKKEERGSLTATGNGYSMMRFMQEGQDEMKTFRKQVGNANKFNTFNQVMLSLPKVEEGFLHFLKCFEKKSSSFRSCGVLTLLGEELVDCFKLCGVPHVDEARVFALVREVHEYTPPDNAGADIDRTGELDVTFTQVIGSSLAVDLFAPEDDFSETCSKVCGAFGIVRSTFNLLDTDGDGEISPEELQSSGLIMGDLSFGNELFKSFDGMPSVSIGEMSGIFAKWTLLSEGDEYAVLKREGDDADSNGVNSAASEDAHSDVSSISLTDFVEVAKSPKSKDDMASVHGSAISIALEKSTKRGGSFFGKIVGLGEAREESANSDDVMSIFTELMKTQTKNSFARFSREGKQELTKEEFTKLVHNVMDTASDKAVLELFDRFSDKSGEVVPFSNIKSVVNPDQAAKAETELGALTENNKSKSSSKAWVIQEGDALHRAIVFARFLAAIYYLIVVPYECALIHPRATANSESVSMQIFIVGWCVDIVLFFDLWSKFHLTYTNRRGLKVDSLVKIRKHYLAHGFTFDLIAIIPIDLIVYTTLSTSVTRLGYFRLPKLLRCVDIINHFSAKLAKASASTRIKTEIQILFSLLFSLLHISACLWFALTDPTVDSNGNTYLDNYNGKFDGFGSSSSSEIYFEQYLLALYWVTGTLTTMGQGGGDLMPQNSRERIFAIYLMMMNLSIYAYILGVISNLFMSADEAIVQKRAEISALERYISSNKIDATLEKEIRSAMSNNGQHGVSVEDERAVFKKLSHSLQVQVSKHTCSELVDNVKAFKDCDQHFRENVCTELTEENFGPGTYIVKKKEPCQSFFVVAAGTVDVVGHDEGPSADERKLAEVGIGAVIGEIPFFFNMRHSDTYRTSMGSHVRVFVMYKDKYDRLIKQYPDEEEKITQNVLSQIDLNRSGNGKRKGSSVSDAASSVASGDNSSVGDSSVGEGSQLSGDGSGNGSDEDGSRVDTDDDHVDMVKRAIEKKREKRALQSHYALCLAAGKGEVDVLRKAINTGLDIDKCQYFGRSPLHIASSEGNLEVVKYLTPLMESPNVFDRRNNTPLMDAVRHTHSEVAKYLKSVGCTLNEDFASIELSNACADGDEKKVELLLQLDVNPSLNPPGRRRGASRRRRSATHMAASNNHVGCMKLLIKYWAKLNTFDAWGGTPLADAIRHDHVHMQDVLRKAGAKLKEVGLCTAAAAGDLETIKLMCDNGADINVTNYIGRTMLHLACSNKQPSVIEYLLGFKHIDLNPCDWYGGTPLDDADREENTSIGVMIKEAGGKYSRDSSLKANLTEMQNKRMSEKEKAEKQRETDKKLDALRGQVLAKVSKIGQVAILDIASLKRLWDSLSLSLNNNTWRKQQALDKSPKPSLAEVLRYFRASFASFMKVKYAINKLNCYEVVASFASTLKAGKVHSPSLYMDLVVSIFDEYFEESSPAYVSVNPLAVTELVSFVKEKSTDSSKVIENCGYDANSKRCSKNVYQKVLEELETNLIDDYLPIFFQSQEYKAIHRHPSGRVWRVKHMCKTARILCNRLEMELANVVEKMVKDDEMKDMYKGSTGYNNLTLEGACNLKSNLIACRDRIETITVIISSVYQKAHKKASILSQQRQDIKKGGNWKGVKG